MIAVAAEGQVPERTMRLAAAIDRVMWDRNGPVLAAIRILADEELRDALRAADILRALDAQHQPRRWGSQSNTVVCDVCNRAYPCPTRDALDGR